MNVAPNLNGDPIADPVQPISRVVSIVRALEHYFTGKSPRSMSDIPWPLDPQVLTANLGLRVRERKFTPNQGARLLLLADAYLLAPLAEDAGQALERGEGSVPDLAVSSTLCALIGLVGQPEQILAAAVHYERLAGIPQADAVLDYLIVARDALGPAVDSGQLAERMQRRAERLLQSNDFESQIEGRDLLGDKDNILQEIDWADESRKRLTAVTDPETRLTALLDIYMERTDAYGERYLTPWVVRKIRKIAHEHGRDVVVDALRAEVERARPDRDQDPEPAFTSIRAMRAMLYFGAILTKEDAEFFEAYADDQMDPLSREQLMPHPIEDAADEEDDSDQ